VGAIKPDTIHNADFWIQLNQKFAEVWPNILVKGDPLPKADIWADTKNKLSLLSEKAAS
jgi:ferredoxin